MKKYAFAAAGTAMLLAAALAVIYYFITAPAKAAAADLQAINAISVGQTTEADLLRRPVFQKLERHCYREECMYAMGVQNTFLSRLHLAPRTSLGMMVNVRDGVVTRVSVMTVRFGKPPLSLVQATDMHGCGTSPCVKDFILPNKTMTSTRISFDNQSEIRNRLSQAIDVSCLSRLHGCPSNLEFVPLLKELGGDISMR